MISDETRDKWRNKINAVVEAEASGIIKLNDWEISFIDSIDIQMGSIGSELSFKQSKCLNKIYERIE